MVSDAVCQKRAHIATKVMPIKRLRFRTYGIEAFFNASPCWLRGPLCGTLPCRTGRERCHIYKFSMKSEKYDFQVWLSPENVKMINPKPCRIKTKMDPKTSKYIVIT